MKKYILSSVIMIFVATILSNYLSNRYNKLKMTKIVRNKITKDCYKEADGDKLMKKICDCFVDETIKSNDPFELFTNYRKNPFSVVEEMNEKHFNTCLIKLSEEMLGE